MTIDELRQRIQLDSTTWQAVLQHAQDMRAEHAEAVMALANFADAEPGELVEKIIEAVS